MTKKALKKAQQDMIRPLIEGIARAQGMNIDKNGKLYFSSFSQGELFKYFSNKLLAELRKNKLVLSAEHAEDLPEFVNTRRKQVYFFSVKHFIIDETNEGEQDNGK